MGGGEPHEGASQRAELAAFGGSKTVAPRRDARLGLLGAALPDVENIEHAAGIMRAASGACLNSETMTTRAVTWWRFRRCGR